MHRSLHPPTHRRVRPARAFPPYATASPIMQRNLHPPSHRHAPPAFQLVPPALSRVPHNAQEPPSSIAPTRTAGYPARAARPPPRPSYCTGATILHRTVMHRRLTSSCRPSSAASIILHRSPHPPSHRLHSKAQHNAKEPPYSAALPLTPEPPSVLLFLLLIFLL
jgi:hypothetical protein